MTMLRAEHRQQAVDTDGEPRFFEFYNQRTGNILMVQQRIDTRDGKRYIPWCYFSDGMWRAMEPDGDLPFWKPKQATDKNKIMVHEGAKAAAHVTAMCADESCTHPWIDELRQYEHWGMIGGALSPHRANYQELWDRELTRMVYVCDNDWPGRQALPLVSKNYKRTMAGVYFDNNWPVHWDMADDMPRNLYTSAGRYIGKELSELMRFCTWATDEIMPTPKPGAGRPKKPVLVISPYFIKEWAHVRKPEVYVHVEAARHYLSEREFNSWVNPFSDTDETAKFLRRRDAHKAAGLHYNPHQPSGLVKDSTDYNYVNTYVPPRIKAEPGDCGPWVDYLNATFPNEQDRNEVIRWCATLVCRPEIKINYGLLLISENQGVGKSTLGSDILKPLLGDWNCSEPSEKVVVESDFNSWCAHKRLAIVHEIYAGHNAKAYDQLKSVITEATLTVNEKYQAEYKIENWLHVLACSNSKRALKLSMDDRRWLVPLVSENKRHPDEWARLHAWLKDEGGYGKIKFWMETWLRQHGAVERGVDAPFTASKQDVVREGYGPGGALVKTFLDRLKEESDGQRIVIPDLDLQRMVRDHAYEGRQNDKMEKPATLRKIAKGEGWFVSPNPVRSVTWAVNRNARAYVITNDPAVAAMSPDEVTREFPRPFDVASKAREYFGGF
jgi:hypothetical protein